MYQDTKLSGTELPASSPTPDHKTNITKENLQAYQFNILSVAMHKSAGIKLTFLNE